MKQIASFNWDETNAKSISKDKPKTHAESFFIAKLNDQTQTGIAINGRFLKTNW